MRTILVDLNDPRLGYEKSVIDSVEKFNELTSRTISPNSPDYMTYLELREKLTLDIPEFIKARDITRRCSAVDISCEDLLPEDLWSCNIHATHATSSEMFERDMYTNGCIRVALSGYDTDGKCKKKIYFDCPPLSNKDRSQLTRLSLDEFLRRCHKLNGLNQSTIQDSSLLEDSVEPDSKIIAQDFSLSDKEKEILENILNRKWNNVFITGGAGTGKTLLLKSIIGELEKSGKNFIICAPTATAALNVNNNLGRTLHSVFNIRCDNVIPFDTKGNIDISKEVIDADIIIIDEISMARMDIFKYVIKTIERAEKICYKNLHPNESDDGSIPKQLIFVGDFFQLPPVITKENMVDLFDNGWSLEALKRGGFCFFTDEWKQRITGDNFIELTEIFRQKNIDFISKLSQLRTGCNRDNTIKDQLVKYFNKFNRSFLDKDNIVDLCHKNDTASQINEKGLSRLPDKFEYYECLIAKSTSESNNNDTTTQKKSVKESIISKTSGDYKYITDMLWEEYKDLMVLKIKTGAKIIMTVNDNIGKKYYNGSQGIVHSLSKDTIMVKLLENGKYSRPISITRVEFKARVNTDSLDKDNTYTIYQFPIKVAYAITIHKSQGMTINRACIHPETYSPGELYVALSRIKDPAGLFLSDKLARRYIQTSQDVINLYNRQTDRFPTPNQVGLPDKESLRK